MAKFYGAVGYKESVESAPSVWTDTITERNYYGDLIRNVRRLDGGSKVIDDVSITNSISIVADPYAIDNFLSILYVEWLGKRWKVPSVEVQFPRLILSIGEVYNG